MTDEVVDARLRAFRMAWIVGTIVVVFLVSILLHEDSESPHTPFPYHLLMTAFCLCITLPMVVIVCCTTSRIDKAVPDLVENELNPKFRQAGFRIEYVVEPSSCCWNRKSYYAIYRTVAPSAASTTTVEWPIPSSSSPSYTIDGLEIFSMLAYTNMRPERRHQLAKAIGLWNLGGVSLGSGTKTCGTRVRALLQDCQNC